MFVCLAVRHRRSGPKSCCHAGCYEKNYKQACDEKRGFSYHELSTVPTEVLSIQVAFDVVFLAVATYKDYYSADVRLGNSKQALLPAWLQKKTFAELVRAFTYVRNAGRAHPTPVTVL